MTSKTSFFKQLREDARHRIWVPALSCIVFLLGLVAATLMLQSIVINQGDISANYLQTRLNQETAMLFNSSNLLLSLVAITGAVICALQGFSYLFNKQQLDFYHALPIRRQKLFIIRWANGVLFYVVPALIFSLLCLIVLAAFGLFNAPMLFAVGTGFLHNLLIFFVVYHTAILFCMLSGHILVSLGLLSIFSIYMFMIVELIPTFMSVYYTTYQNYSYGLSGYLSYLAPAYLVYKLLNVTTLPLLGYAVIFATVLFFGSIILYLRRPSETAGKAIAFSGLQPVIRVLIVVPVAIYIGLAFGQLASGSRAFWSIFGLLLFAVLIHMILNVIFAFDIHAALQHRKELAFSAIISVLFISVFAFNILKLDDQIPALNSVEAVYMDLPVDNDVPYLNLQNGNYLGVTDYRESHAMLTGDELSKAYALLDYRMAPPPTTTTAPTTYTDAEPPVANLNVRFVKSNGHSEYRNFQFIMNENSIQALADVYNTTTYKQGHYQIFDASCDTVFDTFNAIDATENTIVRNTTHTNIFSASETKELMDVLRTDLSAFTLEQMINEIPLGTVSLENSKMLYTMNYRIYPSFTNTVTWLTDHGIDFGAWKESTPVSMTLYLNEPPENKDNADSDLYGYDDSTVDSGEENDSIYSSATSDDVSSEYIITDPAAIRTIYPYLYSDSMNDRNVLSYQFGKLTYNTATITFKDPNTGNTYSACFSITNDCDLTMYTGKTEN
ncbi:MAG: DUF6449 domain-containing protein [Lachnospiraceae bacterium]